MAGFKTHITTSTVLGVAYGGTALAVYHVPLPTCVLAGGLCSISGMLPDLDSEPGIPLRESVAFAAAVVPMLLIDRFRHLGLSHESMVLAGGAIYLSIRFGLASLLQHWTVHRGMFHSLPAAIIFAQVAFLLCSAGGLPIRFFEAGGVILGFMSHLILDEIWSVQFKYGIPRLKSTFGTAVKFWGPSGWSNIATYLLLAATTLATLNDPIFGGAAVPEQEAQQVANSLLEQLQR